MSMEPVEQFNNILDSLELSPTKKQSAGSVLTLFDLKKPLKRKLLAQRIAQTDTLVQKIKKLESKCSSLKLQLYDLKQNAQEIHKIYEKEKYEHSILKESTKILQNKYENLDTEYYRIKYENEQLDATLCDKIDVEKYDRLVVRYLNILQKPDENTSHWKNQAFVNELYNYCSEKNIKGVTKPISPKKRMKKTDKAVQCILLKDEPIKKRVMCTVSTQSNDNISIQRMDNQEISKKSTRSQGTQHKNSTTTRGTTTECFIKKHHVSTMFPDPKLIPSIDNILNEFLDWQITKPITPIVDISSNTITKQTQTINSSIITKTAGTCTYICNVERQVDYIAPIAPIKRSNSRPPSRTADNIIKCEIPTPTATPSSNRRKSFANPIQFAPLSQLQNSEFAVAWQTLGQVMLGLLQNNCSNFINHTTQQQQQQQHQQENVQTNPTVETLNRQEFMNWVYSIYENTQHSNSPQEQETVPNIHENNSASVHMHQGTPLLVSTSTFVCESDIINTEAIRVGPSFSTNCDLKATKENFVLHTHNKKSKKNKHRKNEKRKMKVDVIENEKGNNSNEDTFVNSNAVSQTVENTNKNILIEENKFNKSKLNRNKDRIMELDELENENIDNSNKDTIGNSISFFQTIDNNNKNILMKEQTQKISEESKHSRNKIQQMRADKIENESVKNPNKDTSVYSIDYLPFNENNHKNILIEDQTQRKSKKRKRSRKKNRKMQVDEIENENIENSNKDTIVNSIGFFQTIDNNNKNILIEEQTQKISEESNHSRNKNRKLQVDEIENENIEKTNNETFVNAIRFLQPIDNNTKNVFKEDQTEECLEEIKEEEKKFKIEHVRRVLNFDVIEQQIITKTNQLTSNTLTVGQKNYFQESTFENNENTIFSVVEFMERNKSADNHHSEKTNLSSSTITSKQFEFLTMETKTALSNSKSLLLEPKSINKINTNRTPAKSYVPDSHKSDANQMIVPVSVDGNDEIISEQFHSNKIGSNTSVILPVSLNNYKQNISHRKSNIESERSICKVIEEKALHTKFPGEKISTDVVVVACTDKLTNVEHKNEQLEIGIDSSVSMCGVNSGQKTLKRGGDNKRDLYYNLFGSDTDEELEEVYNGHKSSTDLGHLGTNIKSTTKGNTNNSERLSDKRYSKSFNCNVEYTRSVLADDLAFSDSDDDFIEEISKELEHVKENALEATHTLTEQNHQLFDVENHPTVKVDSDIINPETASILQKVVDNSADAGNVQISNQSSNDVEDLNQKNICNSDEEETTLIIDEQNVNKNINIYNNTNDDNSMLISPETLSSLSLTTVMTSPSTNSNKLINFIENSCSLRQTSPASSESQNRIQSVATMLDNDGINELSTDNENEIIDELLIDNKKPNHLSSLSVDELREVVGKNRTILPLKSVGNTREKRGVKRKASPPSLPAHLDFKRKEGFDTTPLVLENISTSIILPIELGKYTTPPTIQPKIMQNIFPESTNNDVKFKIVENLIPTMTVGFFKERHEVEIDHYVQTNYDIIEESCSNTLINPNAEMPIEQSTINLSKVTMQKNVEIVTHNHGKDMHENMTAINQVYDGSLVVKGEENLSACLLLNDNNVFNTKSINKTTEVTDADADAETVLLSEKSVRMNVKYSDVPTIAVSATNFYTDSPASPERPSAIDFTNTPITRTDISTNSVSTTPNILRYGSLLQQLVCSYNAKQYPLFLPTPKTIETNEHIIKRLKESFNCYLISTMASDQQWLAADKLHKSFLNITHNLDMIAGAIVQHLQHFPREENPINPTITTVQERILTALQYFEQQHNQFVLKLLTKVETTLFHGHGHNKFQLSHALNLTQLYLMFLAMQQPKMHINPSRLFIAKCIYYHYNIATAMIYEVLCQYPTTLPHREERSYDHSDAIITVIKHCLMCNKYDMNDSELRSRELLSKLRYEYHFEPFQPLREEVLKNLIDKLKCGKLLHLSFAFAIFCKRIHPAKVLHEIVIARLMPIASEYFDLALESDCYDARIAELMECISMVIKAMPRETNVMMFLKTFARYYNGIKRPVVQEAAVQSILRLQQFGYADCFNAMLNFKPTFELQSSTKAMLRTFLYRKPLKFWKKLQEQAAVIDN